ncbi:aminotransferase class IV [Spirosoma taeanense]|uniref:branched-chain-amino-acid transaminase n=1 Tax=Spirosoma taeanense TaxID=2735870 RepID=A0A6M5Y297_9BACT|nr:aminotransferase class IV [Spirosoma taeanense]QJW88797.1 aminotransferase class IV [Spirosoma taeanense]
MFLVYNSDVIPENDFHLLADDRAFHYGDGLFETIRAENGRVWFWSDHYERLTTGMGALRLSLPNTFTAEAIHQAILHLLDLNGLASECARIKLLVWRQTGGLYTPTTNRANILIMVRPGTAFSVTRKTKLGIYDQIRLAPSAISAFKTLNSLPYVLAGVFKQENDLDDVILLDTNGHLAECLASNLYWLRDGILYTPALQTGCINGISRRQILQKIPNVQEGFFFPDALDAANVIFAANVAGIQVFKGEIDTPLFSSIRQLFMAY